MLAALAIFKTSGAGGSVGAALAGASVAGASVATAGGSVAGEAALKITENTTSRDKIHVKRFSFSFWHLGSVSLQKFA
ncbi:MAG: hypothetical protein U0X93_00760 [Anaerolineales bacterium]